MADAPKPKHLFDVAVADDDIKMLDSNYEDHTDSVPADMMAAFKSAGRPLSGNRVVLILAGGSRWLISDGYFYDVKAADGKAGIYQITAGVASVLRAQSHTATGFTALNIVTAACHAILNTQLTPPKTKPSWFDTINKDLDDAKVLAKEWIDELSPAMTASLPTQVVDYSTTYTALTASIVKIAEANPTAQGKDNTAVQETFQLIDGLKSQVGKIHGNLETVDEKLTEWGDKMQVAHDKLYNGAVNIQSSLIDIAADIKKYTEDIKTQNSLIEGERKAITYAAMAIGIGIFIAIIGIALIATGVGAVAGGLVTAVGGAAVIGGAVTWGIMQHRINEQLDTIADDQKHIAEDKLQQASLQALSIGTNNAVGSIATATSTLSSVKAMWKVFEGELQGVLDKLNSADQDLMLIVNEAFVNGAAEEWKLAEEFAQKLVGMPEPEVKSTTLQVHKAA